MSRRCREVGNIVASHDGRRPWPTLLGGRITISSLPVLVDARTGEAALLGQRLDPNGTEGYVAPRTPRAQLFDRQGRFRALRVVEP